MHDPSSFGRWLKQQRKALGLTQDDLARQVGCAVVTLQKIEADARRPSAQLAQRLADHLALRFDERALFLELARPELRPAHDQLALPTTALIGRAAEVATLIEHLHRPTVRLFTLTGPPGIGKTRLALQVAAELSATFASGVCFVHLASLHDPCLVAPAVAEALGLTDIGEQSLVERLKRILAHKQLLLVLDNFEQVLAAAPLTIDLLQAAPELKILVTSRAVLRVSGEYEFVAPPLSLPDLAHLPPLDQLAHCPSVALFVERAQAAAATFALTTANAPVVAAICAQLDGIPLAIELAAARNKLFSPEALLARLDNRLAVLTDGARDLPPRHQTLRSALAWSYDLLDAPAQLLFRRLGIFEGGCTLEAAEAICDPEFSIADWNHTARGKDQHLRHAQRALEHDEIPRTQNGLDTLAALVDKSLLYHRTGPDGELRFRMLETIREYALDQLRESGEEDLLARRHAAYYLALAEQAASSRQEFEQKAWLDRLGRESDNLRTALRWSTAHGEVEIGLRLATALQRFWFTHAGLCEGQQWYATLLMLDMKVGHVSPVAVRAEALTNAGLIACFRGDYGQAEQ